MPLDGFCGCGCGQLTPIATRTDRTQGWTKGKPKRFIYGHQARLQGRALLTKIKRTNCGFKSDCWLWQGRIDGSGYGVFGSRKAHQAVWTLMRGPIPKGLQPDHLCRQRQCVNPDHMELVTSAVNTQRGLKAKITAAQVLEIRESRLKSSDLALIYGISAAQVTRIRRRQNWTNI